MRLNEGDEVEEAFRKWDINFVRVNAEELFLSKLAGVSEPERKRKIIGEEFIRVFEAEAKKIGQVDYLAQGTIYPDVIESGAGDAAVKSWIFCVWRILSSGTRSPRRIWRAP